MTPAAIGFLITLGALLLFALIGVIIINRSTIITGSLKQQEKEKSTTAT
jgi:UPF0716 family protein affecting phage T7 exclusion